MAGHVMRGRPDPAIPQFGDHPPERSTWAAPFWASGTPAWGRELLSGPLDHMPPAGPAEFERRLRGALDVAQRGDRVLLVAGLDGCVGPRAAPRAVAAGHRDRASAEAEVRHGQALFPDMYSSFTIVSASSSPPLSATGYPAGRPFNAPAMGEGKRTPLDRTHSWL